MFSNGVGIGMVKKILNKPLLVQTRVPVVCFEVVVGYQGLGMRATRYGIGAIHLFAIIVMVFVLSEPSVKIDG